MAAILASCSSKECYDNQNTLPLAAFYAMEGHASVTLDSVTIYGIGAPNDSLLADTARREEIYLPFRPEAGNTSFVFRYEWQQAPRPDTLTFHYDTRPWFTGEECGVVYYYYVDSISHTRHLMDSVSVPGMVITNAARRNIEIFFRGEVRQ